MLIKITFCNIIYNVKKYKKRGQTMTKKIGIILGIILTVLLMCSTINYAVNDTTGIYLGLKGKSTSRETGKYTFNNKDVFKIVKYNNTSGTAEVGDNTSIYCV